MMETEPTVGGLTTAVVLMTVQQLNQATRFRQLDLPAPAPGPVETELSLQMKLVSIPEAGQQAVQHCVKMRSAGHVTEPSPFLFAHLSAVMEFWSELKSVKVQAWARYPLTAQTA